MKYVLFLGAFMLVACQSGWDKDPLAEFSENIKQGQVPGSQNQPKSIPSKILRIDVADFYEVVEGEEVTITPKYRIFDRKASFHSLSIPNLQTALPGAIFDASENSISWSAPIGFVSENVGNRSMAIKHLQFELTAYREGVLIKERRTASVYIFRGQNNSLKIVNVEGHPFNVTEGEVVENIFVTVEDLESRTEDNLPPDLLIRRRWVDDDGPHFFRVVDGPNPVANEPNRWIFELAIDLSRYDASDRPEHKFILLSAKSFFGEVSQSKELTFRTLNRLVAPETTWSQTVTFNREVKNHMFFTVYDPEVFYVLPAVAVKQMIYGRFLGMAWQYKANTSEQ